MKSKVYLATVLFGLTVVAGSAVVIAASPPSINGEARVISTTERYVTVREVRPTEECREVQVSSSGSTSSDTPELLGAIIGGAIGKEFDDSSDAGAIIGGLLGASIASDMEKKNAQNRGSSRTEVQCATVNREVEVRRADGYDVTYEYDGHLFTYKMNNYPGTTIPVRVFVLPVQ